jgi:NAD(P)-dependent dehydrogenase (short-subunit alcohol dehydrogenase family)
MHITPHGRSPLSPPRTALITGAARRIGAAMALDLAQQGFVVVVHCRRADDDAHTLISQMHGSGGKAYLVEGDLTQPEAADAVFQQARRLAGPIGLLVNNASIFEPDSAFDGASAHFEAHFALHVRVPAQLGALFARQEDIESGLIVHVIDQRVWRLNPGFFSYTLSKSALWAMTRTQAQAFAPKIRVNAIAPGPTLPNSRQHEADFARQVAGLPLRRGPKLEEFGATLRYLLAVESVTGQMIALDGGQHLAWETPDIAGIRE